jgi:hypothetical protein
MERISKGTPMRNIFLLSTLATTLAFTSVAETDPRCFELRTYHAAPGKLDALNARFRDHTMELFKKHGMVNVGYWVPVDNTNNVLIYLLAYPSREAREKSWKAFMADPEWQAAQKASEENGRLVLRVESVFMRATDYSPRVEPSSADAPRLFELRKYHASPGKLDDLHARFKDHTMALFTRHGMTNFGYFVPTEEKDGAGERLIYILAHRDKESAGASWKAFREDPDWVKAKSDSEVHGPLTVSGGVESIYMSPTDYSPTK